MESPTNRVDALMDEFRRDLDGWNIELARLRAERQTDLVEKIESWMRDVEEVLARWQG